MTPSPAFITATVDTEAGQRIEDSTLAVRVIVRLGCGCHRYECDRPGGGVVHVLVGDHCFRFAGPLAGVPSLDEAGRAEQARALAAMHEWSACPQALAGVA